MMQDEERIFGQEGWADMEGTPDASAKSGGRESSLEVGQPCR